MASILLSKQGVRVRVLLCANFFSQQDIVIAAYNLSNSRLTIKEDELVRDLRIPKT